LHHKGSNLNQAAQANVIASLTEQDTHLTREILPVIGLTATPANMVGQAFANAIPVAGLSRANGVITETETHTYNAFNQLVRVENVSTTVTYTYRADGLRRSKTISGTTTTHVWMGSQIVLERRGDNGTVINRFHRSASGRMIRSEHHGWYLHNVRGDVVQRVDENGNDLRRYRYSAFGIERAQNASNTNPFRFAGMYWDWATSTYMTPNRHFSPRLGRWTQPDPFWNIGNMQRGSLAVQQSSNLFMFALHNPVKWNDPSGLFVIPGLINPSDMQIQAQWRAAQASNVEQQTVDADGVNSPTRTVNNVQRVEDARRQGDQVFPELEVPFRFLWPTESRRVTSVFGYRVHPIHGDLRLHTGIDIGIPTGTNVYAAAGGTVTGAFFDRSGGHMIVILSEDGTRTRYMHLRQHDTVYVGQQIYQGQWIGYSGNSGGSTAAHLHFDISIREDGAWVFIDPLDYLGGARFGR